jgi:transcriptional regulator with XRE-family HTH domain
MDNNIVKRVLDKDLENIVRKVAEGKTLTSTERARIATESTDLESEQRFADNLTELAETLGVSRMTIDRWKKKKCSPKPTPNGKHNIQKWRDFTRKNGLKTELDTDEETALKVRKLLAEVKQAELKLSVMEGNYVSIEKVREVWTAHIGQVRSILESRFLNELPPILTALDAIQIREKLRDVLDEAYSAISSASDSMSETVED